MKYLYNFSLFTLFIILTLLPACNENDGTGPCTDPIATYVFPSSASKWLFQPIVPKDTIKFNVYHRDNRSSPYVYRKSESFIIKDTVIKKIEMKNFVTYNCNQFMYNDYLVADITGPESLTCELDNGAITQLIINLQNIEFEVADIQYKATQANWNDSLTIGGQKYYNVKNFTGVSPNAIDSTYCFYNLQYGMLKFIINDTLIYQRKLH